VKVYGCFAPALKDYYDYRIFQRTDTPEGVALGLLVDPYSYIRRPGFRSRLSLPKFLINSPGDQFFLPDAAQFYWSRLPVEKRIRYVPNSDHSLRNTAAVFLNTLTGLLGWYSAVLFATPRPPISWFLKNSGMLVVRDPSPGATAKLWRATSPTARDFRLESIDEAWTSPVLRKTLTGDYEARVPPPRSGWTAYFVEVTYPGVVPQIYSTQVLVTPDRLRPFEEVNVTQASLCTQYPQALKRPRSRTMD
jgi:PhoPQ-activated pathogenicity-related protein